MTSLPSIGARDALFIIDLLTFVRRAYHSVAPLSSPSDEPTQATYLTMKLLDRLIAERDPKLLAVAIDSKGPSVRKSIDPNYKANRTAPPDDFGVLVERVRSLIELCGIQVWHVEGFEADDVIATAVRLALDADLRVVIASSDKDMMQLVGPRVVLWDSMRNKVYGTDEVIAKFGVRPDQVGDLLALWGDSSDNIKGVPAVGQKKASELLNLFGSMEEIYRSLDQIKGRIGDNLRIHQHAAHIAKRLVTLRTDLPIPFDVITLERRHHHNESWLRDAFDELGFTQSPMRISAPHARNDETQQQIW